MCACYYKICLNHMCLLARGMCLLAMRYVFTLLWCMKAGLGVYEVSFRFDVGVIEGLGLMLA